jgi:hypothetical protein
MLSEDELTQALATALEELVAGVQPSLKLVVAAQRVPATSRMRRERRRRALRRLLLSASLPVAGALSAMGLLLAVAAGPPSFVVRRTADGTISVTLRQIAGVSGANRRLRALNARVVVIPITQGCTSHVSLSYMAVGSPLSSTVQISPAGIQAPWTVILAAKQIPGNGIEFAVGRVSGPPPACAAPGTTGPGITPVGPTASRRG